MAFCSTALGGISRKSAWLAVITIVILLMISIVGRQPVLQLFSPKHSLSEDVFVVMKPETVASELMTRDLAMFRYVIDWLESPTSECRQLLPVGDHGYPACFDSPMKLPKDSSVASQSCLVYSIGLSSDWSFEKNLAERGCEVHVFDFSASEPPAMSFMEVKFHQFNFGAALNYKMWSVDDLMAFLGHQNMTIQFLKMTVGTMAIPFLSSQLLYINDKFVLDRVEQVGMDVALPTDIENNTKRITQFHKLEATLGRIGQVGFRLVGSVGLGRRRYLYPSMDRLVYSEYHLHLVKKGRDIFDRMMRNGMRMEKAGYW